MTRILAVGLAFLAGFFFGARTECRLHWALGCNLGKETADNPPAPPGTVQPFNLSTFQP